jgi:hypothetical protein
MKNNYKQMNKLVNLITEGCSCGENKMTMSSLKSKIREAIISELESDYDDENYEKSSREIEYAMDKYSDEKYYMAAMKAKKYGLTHEEAVEKLEGMGLEYAEACNIVYTAYEPGEEPIYEKKDESSEEEDKDIEFEDEDEDHTDSKTEELSKEEQELQMYLNKALEVSRKIGDKKLENQIGNTITFFTRSYVSDHKD